VNYEAYISSLRRDADVLHAQKDSITERGSRCWSRWGSAPMVETTGPWLKELDRRINELETIASAMERRLPF
jgi:hypothetical protein